MLLPSLIAAFHRNSKEGKCFAPVRRQREGSSVKSSDCVGGCSICWALKVRAQKKAAIQIPAIQLWFAKNGMPPKSSNYSNGWIAIVSSGWGTESGSQGPRPHRSLRLPSGQVPTTLRRPIANLLENFYDKVWLAGLLPHQRIELNASNTVELPLYVFTWPTNASLPVDPR